MLISLSSTATIWGDQQSQRSLQSSVTMPRRQALEEVRKPVRLSNFGS